MQHSKWFLDTVEPRLWAIIDLDYILYSAVAEVQPQWFVAC